MRRIHALPIAALLMATACQSIPPSVSGEWDYNACLDSGLEHMAGLFLQQEGGRITGSWSDGDSRGMGEHGDLTGQVRDGKAYLRFCTEVVRRGQSTCPDFGEEAAYVVRDGEKLRWFERVGAGYDHYLTLHRAGAPQDTEDGPRCEDL